MERNGSPSSAQQTTTPVPIAQQLYECFTAQGWYCRSPPADWSSCPMGRSPSHASGWCQSCRRRHLRTKCLSIQSILSTSRARPCRPGSAALKDAGAACAAPKAQVLKAHLLLRATFAASMICMQVNKVPVTGEPAICGSPNAYICAPSGTRIASSHLVEAGV